MFYLFYCFQSIECISLSRDGSHVACGTTGGHVFIYDRETSKVTIIMRGILSLNLDSHCFDLELNINSRFNILKYECISPLIFIIYLFYSGNQLIQWTRWSHHRLLLRGE